MSCLKRVKQSKVAGCEYLLGLLFLVAAPVVGAMDFGTYSGYCRENGGTAVVGSNGVYQCNFSSESAPSGGSSSSGGGSSRSAMPSGGGPTPQQQLIQQGVAIGAYALGQELHKAIFGDPEQAARRQAEAAARAAEQKRRDEEAARQAEETKQRLLGETRSTDPNSLSLMGVEPAPDLQLMNGDESPSASVQPDPSKNAPGGAPPKHSDAFNRGFNDASQCYSQNAGSRCAGITGDQWQVCLSDYRSGYQVGDKQRQQSMHEAHRAGQSAGASGLLADAASDPRALGPCRTQWIEAYNRGYQETHARLGVGSKK